MRHGTEPLRRSSGSYEGSFGLILVMGWEWELNSMRSNLPLFLSSSVVERSAVNRLVVGSNPIRGDWELFGGSVEWNMFQTMDDWDDDAFSGKRTHAKSMKIWMIHIKNSQWWVWAGYRKHPCGMGRLPHPPTHYRTNHFTFTLILLIFLERKDSDHIGNYPWLFNDLRCYKENVVLSVRGISISSSYWFDFWILLHR